MTLLVVDRVSKSFPRPGGLFASGPDVRAVDEVSFALEAGARLGVVGESGCGKSTLGRIIIGLHRPDAGHVLIDGQDVHAATGAAAHELRRRVQMIWQDTAGALDPRLRVGDVLTEPLVVHGMVDGRAERERRAVEWLERVGLDASLVRRRPHELSGGQRQRIGIARALALGPALLVADEPVASLDVSVQTQILRLLADLVADTHVALLFISHDIRVVRALTERVLVLYRGRAVELGPTAAVTHQPLHPYTQALIAAVPALHPDARHVRPPTAEGEPSDANAGCAFVARCGSAEPGCSTEHPAWREVRPGHWVACSASS
jgi:oligopeptide/dipeptide ABC transporter ATP-binding protein